MTVEKMTTADARKILRYTGKLTGVAFDIAVKSANMTQRKLARNIIRLNKLVLKGRSLMYDLKTAALNAECFKFDNSEILNATKDLTVKHFFAARKSLVSAVFDFLVNFRPSEEAHTEGYYEWLLGTDIHQFIADYIA